MIPKPLRQMLGLNSGIEYQFFLHEINGRRYICIECPELPLERAKEEDN